MQLRNVLQMTTANKDLMAMKSRDIGLDSLFSVDIRSWFLKNFEVGVPVLKIMDNDTMAKLADLVAASLLPGLGAGEAPTSNEEAPVTNGTSQPVPDVVIQNDKINSKVYSNPNGTFAESSGGSTGVSMPASCKPQVMNGTLQKGTVRIDWDAEIALPEAVKIATDMAPAARTRVIVLTGVSGLLGRHQRLLQDRSVVELICIAVRRLDERLRSKELPEDDYIQYFDGDLEEPRLGLSEKDTILIFSRVDTIVHNSADTSHLKFYPEIKAANTGSTKELIRLS